ncbi:ATP-binding protein [Paenibacillus motobuensis]|uniref:histidine kinase n=1 Tax=Paenibacillus motobuensis TaxID=295324 RepID=A0ABN0Y7T8_9BACL
MNGPLEYVSDYQELKSAYPKGKPVLHNNLPAVIMHEVRNSLTVTRGFIQLLQPQFVKVGKDEYARVILMELDKACEMLQDFMAYSKPRSPERTIVDVSELFKELQLLAKSQALAKGCRIEFMEEVEDSMEISIDLKQIKQVLLNMIKNATEAIDELHQERSGLIRISAERNGHFVKLIICDNGSGISAGALARLFEPYFTTKERGTGLGLAVSRQIINDHGGTIKVSSTKGKGTIFDISLPLVIN